MGDITIALVDGQEDIITRRIRRDLKDLGIETNVLTDGLEALREFEAEQYPLILCDSTLAPGDYDPESELRRVWMRTNHGQTRDAYEKVMQHVVERIRDGPNADTPVIVRGPYSTSNQYAQMFLEVGATRYLNTLDVGRPQTVEIIMGYLRPLMAPERPASHEQI